MSIVVFRCWCRLSTGHEKQCVSLCLTEALPETKILRFRGLLEAFQGIERDLLPKRSIRESSRFPTLKNWERGCGLTAIGGIEDDHNPSNPRR
jgi:hypothetical protein